MDSRDAVLAFVRRMTELNAHVSRVMGEPDGEHGVSVLISAVVRQEMPREGELPGGVRYFVHGVGCWLMAADQAEIDVDLSSGQSRIQFDAWRVRRFAESVGASALSELDLVEALERLADEGVIAHTTGADRRWYSMPPVE